MHRFAVAALLLGLGDAIVSPGFAQTTEPSGSSNPPASSPAEPAPANPPTAPQQGAPTASPPAPAGSEPGSSPPPPNAAAQPPASAPAAPQSYPPPTRPAAGLPATVVDLREAEGILGKGVVSANGEDMGRIVDVVVSGDGHMRAAVIDFGGFLGVGSRKVAVDWNALNFGADGKVGQITLSMNRSQLRLTPEYKAGEPIVIMGSPPANAAAPAAPSSTAASAPTAAPAQGAAAQPAAPQPASQPAASQPVPPMPAQSAPQAQPIPAPQPPAPTVGGPASPTGAAPAK